MEDKEFHFGYIKFEMYTEQMREVKEATELMRLEFREEVIIILLISVNPKGQKQKKKFLMNLFLSGLLIRLIFFSSFTLLNCLKQNCCHFHFCPLGI